jgi:hypothetical protein
MKKIVLFVVSALIIGFGSAFIADHASAATKTCGANTVAVPKGAKVTCVGAPAKASPLPSTAACKQLGPFQPDYQSALLAKYGLILRCDNQSFAGGWNLKPAGGAFPVRAGACLFRLGGVGGVANGSCKYKLLGFTEQNGQLVIRTGTGNFVYTGGTSAQKM